MHDDQQMTLEPQDPVAHPHYPMRPVHAAVVKYVVDTEIVPVDEEESAEPQY